MGISFNDDTATIAGRIGAEDAQDLMTWLADHPQAQVHLGDCEHLHAAALQCLMHHQPRVAAPSPDAWLNRALGCAPGGATVAAAEEEETS